MTNFEAIVKSLIWRFFIAIPVSLSICYYYTNNLNIALEMTIVANIVSTFLYYLFDMIWFRRVNKYFKKNDVK